MRQAEIVEVDRGWVPTRKWIAAQVVALAGVATSAIDSGWDDTEWKLLIGVAVQAAVTYLLPNVATPTGVPDAKAVAVAGPEPTRKAL